MKSAVILFTNEFRYSASIATQYLRRKRYKIFAKCLLEPVAPGAIPKFKCKSDLLIWYSHGGWDGPTIFETPGYPEDQVAPFEIREWIQLKGYFLSQVKPQSVFITHSCHSAGSDKFEKKKKGLEKERNKAWIRDVAKDMNIHAIGQAGLAAPLYPGAAKRMLKFAFTGRNSGIPFHAYAAGSGRRFYNLKSLNL